MFFPCWLLAQGGMSKCFGWRACAGSVLWAAHAGDSRAVLARGARAVRLTEDHKPCLPAERMRVEANGGRVQLGRGQRCWCAPDSGTVLRPCLMTLNMGAL